MSGAGGAPGLRVVGHEAVMPGPEELLRISCRYCSRPHLLRAFLEDPCSGEDVPRVRGRRIDRFSALGMIAVARLVRTWPTADPCGVGVFVLNPSAGWSYGQPQLEALVTEGPRAMQPYQATAWFPAAAQGEVTIQHGFLGEAKSVSGYSGGLGQVWWAAQDAIEAGAVERAIVVLADSRVSSFSMLAASPCGSGSEVPVLAEGAVAVLVEAAHGAGALSVDWTAGRRSSDVTDPLVRASDLGDALSAPLSFCPIDLGDGYALVPATGGTRR